MLRKWLTATLAVVMLLAAGLPAAPVSAHAELELRDELSDWSAVMDRSANWTLDGSGATFFDGDATRAVPTNLDPAYLVYAFDEVQDFQVRFYYFADSQATLRFYGSADGSVWSEIAAVHDTPTSSGDAAWKGVTYSPAGAIAADMSYFKLEITGNITSWHTQLGAVRLSNIATVPLTIEDELADWSKVDAHTASWAFDGSGPANFGGDATRLVPTADTPESITYHLHGVRTFSADIHRFADATAEIVWYGSTDGSVWYELQTSHDTPVSTGDAAWSRATYTPSAPVPADTHYLKLEVSGDAVAWRTQIGSVTVSNRVQSAGQGDYYVDALGGDDDDDGRTPESAWQSLSPVNERTFKPGDRILLKTGGIWSGQLSPKGSGTAEHPITLSSYGTGPKPIINGGGLAGGTVYLRNQSHWIIQNLEITNYASERGDVFREGIFIENAGAGTLSGIRISDNYVHDVSGSFRYAGGDPHAFGGIAVYAGGAGTDRFDGVLIEGNTVERVGRTGIVVWDQVWNGVGYASEQVVIRQNYVKESDSDGILTFGVDGGLIEHNVVEGAGVYSEPGQFNGTAAIWPTRGKNNIVQFNEAFNTYKPEGDGQGFNLDIDTRDSIVQYNYSHDNAGGFILFVDATNTPGTEIGSTNNIVRYNISQNDAKHAFTFAGGVSAGTQIYNNTVYLGANSNAKIIDHEWDDAGDVNAPYTFKNNLIYNLGSGGYNLPGTGGVFDSNLFYGNHPTSEPADPNKVTANPLLVYQGGAAEGWSSVSGYQLRDGSPALGAGTVLPNNGGRDYWGNAVSPTGAPNIGAYGGPGLDPAGLPEAPEDDFTLTYQGLSMTPLISAGRSDPLSLRLRFANDSDAELAISDIQWRVGTSSGKLAKAPAIAPGKGWDYEIALPGLVEGTTYPLSLTADVHGYKPIQVTRQLDYNRVLQQTDKRSAVTIDLAKGQAVFDPPSAYNGSSDLGGTLAVRWDDEYLYLNGDIQDDVMAHGSSGIEIFRNDGIQFSIAPGMPGDSGSWYEYGLAMTPDGPEIYRWMAMQGLKSGTVDNGKLEIERQEDKKLTTYRLRLPWSELRPLQPVAGQVFSLSVLVNDNDGEGRKGYIEWGGGIGGTKDASLFRSIVLMGPQEKDDSGGNNPGSYYPVYPGVSPGGSPDEGEPSVIAAAGSLTVNLSAADAADILLEVEDARRALEQAGDALHVQVQREGKAADGAVIRVPASVIENMKGKADTLVVTIDGATLTLPWQTLAASGASDARPLTIRLQQTTVDEWPASRRGSWQDRPVYTYALQVDGKSIGIGAESATLSLGYVQRTEEQPHRIVAFAIAEDGSSSAIAASRFDSVRSIVTFPAGISGRFGVMEVDAPFADLTEARWAQTMIETLAVRGIVTGTSVGQYEPNRPMTRAEFVQSLVALLQLQGSGDDAASFSDVDPDSEYRVAIGTAYALGIVQGRGDGRFGTQDPISRQEMATLLYRALPELGQTGDLSQAPAFIDQGAISVYAREAVEALHAAGAIGGYPDGRFLPQRLATRAEAAAIFYRIWSR
ncbi:hypothetical protein PA598K_04162 [Paenibacillus sp. 598K]|uniref:S-layer homology domain-containing protein n=1 Tax=Paenibacillus sp. 598K TaxID=1117987 RepID=UPI000FFA3EED|nr:S-layer homology domain-containing protein [Paenibacillus sp. 598K]GBF75734.1 hypothetical protein PA598K_04162 [Paenibacillus sp. 598K]